MQLLILVPKLLYDQGCGRSVYFLLLCKIIHLSIYKLLAWEPSVAQSTHSYSRRLPALFALFFTGKLTFRCKSRPTQLRISKPIINISVGLPSTPIKIWGKSVKGVLGYDRTNKQTNKLYIYRYIRLVSIFLKSIQCIKSYGFPACQLPFLEFLSLLKKFSFKKLNFLFCF